MKKLKLSLSIAMMCLCVSVLCMGILAANSATYNINGNMSYNMIDGVALVNTRVYKVAGTTSESDLSANCTTLSTKSFEEIERETSTYYILSQKLDSQPLINTSTDGTSATNQTSVDIVYGATDSVVDYYTYYVVIGIKNVSTDTGYVLNASITKTDSTEIVSIDSSYVATNTSVSNLANDTFSNIVIGISAKTIEAARALTNSTESFAYTLSVTYGEIPIPTFSELLDTYTDGNSNSYWGVPLGKIASDSETPIIWRYVGDYSTSSDGTETFTCYTTYTSTKPTIGSGSVFVQETALTNNSVAWGSSGDTNYFTGCTLRTSIKDGDLFNLTDVEKTYLTNDCIKERALPDIYWSLYNGDAYSFTYPYTSATEKTYYSDTPDYFWLLSVEEVCLYFNDTLKNGNQEDMNTTHEQIRWLPSGGEVAYWLRSPCLLYQRQGRSNYNTVTSVSDGGVFDGNYGATGTKGIRAAFRLT